ncbi:DUF2306 domain-containing protein [Phaeocystidibacter luteus]|uniref:DUF2306 domain-containing protein n=1 Tax=Phaeocystidibacter luteus TaxID=911197 RepID=A0A6N6RG47_9FLAO|nr:hypothetical protein [Phaeocystidibacter luteus]KAB2807076.1 hypothetical protein F8C67_12845 [Phaeocystidibacter luteus]
METLHATLLFTHILTGTVALLSGTIAGLLRKRRGFHSLFGGIFTYCMYAVAISGFILSAMRYNMFLLAVSIFTLHMVITGSRAFRGMNRNARLGMSIFGWAGSAALLYIGVTALALHSNTMGIVPIIFGALLVSMSRRDYRIYRGTIKPNPVILHLNEMGGALIAAYTAFLTTGAGRVLHGMGYDISQLQVFLWLLPTVIGTLALTRVNFKMRRSVT